VIHDDDVQFGVSYATLTNTPAIRHIHFKNYLEILELRSLSELTVLLIFQNLLGVIGNILATHTRYKRSDDSHFKAFICAALKYVTFLSIAIHVVTQGCYWSSVL